MSNVQYISKDGFNSMDEFYRRGETRGQPNFIQYLDLF